MKPTKKLRVVGILANIMTAIAWAGLLWCPVHTAVWTFLIVGSPLVSILALLGHNQTVTTCKIDELQGIVMDLDTTYTPSV